MDRKRVYFIGIGGIGMSALARHYLHEGWQVSGYDKTPSPVTDALIEQGIPVHFEDDPDLVDKSADLVIYTPAIPASHSGLQFYRQGNYKLIKRSAALGALTEGYRTIAVAGSHGKTTTSAMIAWVLRDTGNDCTAFLGGISTNFKSNYVYGSGDLLVAEADEFDRSFHTLHPHIAVVTAIDSDHLDVYGDTNTLAEAFTTFTGQVDADGLVVCKKGIPIEDRITRRKLSYALQDLAADLFATEITSDKGENRVVLNNGDCFSLRYPGLHNIENAIATYAVCRELGVGAEDIAQALRRFNGIQRRMELVIGHGNCILVDDYAHHPVELDMLIASLRHMYPGKTLNLVFQPHLYTRTRDLADDFAAVLDKADNVLLLPVYPARELPIEGVESEMLVLRMTRNARVVEKDKLVESIRGLEGVLCMAGAGDIDRLVKPVAAALIEGQQI
jgi:UDP-N-acetylmuramate--alanine ligase